MRLKTKRFVILAATALVVSVMTPAAQAALTPVSPAPSGELSRLGSGGILDTLYALGNLERINDAFIHCDQPWERTDSGGSVTALSKLSGFSQEFGLIPDPFRFPVDPLGTSERLCGARSPGLEK